jgi:glycosyltransferase involved in cell wall biosynthesis
MTLLASVINRERQQPIGEQGPTRNLSETMLRSNSATYSHSNREYPMPGPHILIYEPTRGGHQMILIRYLLNGIVRRIPNVRVTLLMSEVAADHINTREVVNDFSNIVTLRVAPTVTAEHRLLRAIDPFYEYQWRNCESFVRGFAEIGPETVDFVLLPYLETIGLLQIGLRPNLFQGRPWATVAITIQFHQRKFGITGPFQFTDLLQGLFLRRILRYPDLVCFGAVNPYLALAMKHPKVVHCPDPATPFSPAPMAEARAAYGIRPETCVVLVFGAMDRRKCVDVLIEGAALAIPETDLTVFLAGPQNTAHIGSALNSPEAGKLRSHGRLIEVNRYIIDGKDIDPVSVADIVWVFYERRFVIGSSVMIRAGAFRRPVITRDSGVIGRQVAEFRCGLAVPSESPAEVAAALTRLARDPALRKEMGDNGARAFAENTPENFARPMVDAISRTLAGQTAAR